MRAAFSFLASRRWAGAGLAVLVEVAVLVPLASANATSVVGIPAAVAAAIAGTVAVVLGPLDGALVALAGATVFGFAGGWEVGELAALGVWPAVVVAAGLFARRVQRQRDALAGVLAAREDERRRIALELHDQTAQALAAALLALRRVERAATADELGAASSATRDLIQTTIENVRELAVELRPKALDDFGLSPAVERLAERFSARTGVAVEVDAAAGRVRLPRDTEITAYRAIEEVLADLAAGEVDGRVRVALERDGAELVVSVDHDREGRPRRAALGLEGVRERVRLAGGRLAIRSTRTGSSVRIALPLHG